MEERGWGGGMAASNGHSHSSNKTLLGWWRQWESIMIIISGKLRHVISSETKEQLTEKEEERGERADKEEEEQDKDMRRRWSRMEKGRCNINYFAAIAIFGSLQIVRAESCLFRGSPAQCCCCCCGNSDIDFSDFSFKFDAWRNLQ